MATRYQRYSARSYGGVEGEKRRRMRLVVESPSSLDYDSPATPSIATLERRHKQALAALQSQIDELRASHRNALSASVELRNKVRDLTAQLAATTEKLRDTEEEVHLRDISLNRHRYVVGKLENELLTAVEEVERLAAENQTYHATLRNYERHYSALAMEADELREKLKRITEARRAAANHEAQLHHTITSLRQELETYKRAAADAESQVAELTRRLEKLQQPASRKIIFYESPNNNIIEEGEKVVPLAEFDELKKKLQAAERENIVLRNEIRRLEIDIHGLQNVVSKNEQTRKRWQQTNEQLRARISELEKVSDDLREENRRLIQAAEGDSKTAALAAELTKLKKQAEMVAIERAREEREKKRREAQIEELTHKVQQLDALLAQQSTEAREKREQSRDLDHQRSKELAELQDKIHQLQREEREKQRVIDRLQVESENLRSELSTAKLHLSEVEELKKKEQQARQQAEKTLLDTQHELNVIKTERDKALRALESREKEIEQRLQDISRLQEELKQSKQRLSTQRLISASVSSSPEDATNQLQEEVSKTLEEKITLEQKLNEMNITLSDITSQKQKAEEECNKLRELLERSEKDTDSLKNDISRLMAEKEALETAEHNARMELEKLNSQLQAAMNDNAKIQSQLAEVQSNASELTKQKRQLEEQLDETCGKLEATTKDHASLKTSYEQLVQELNAIKAQNANAQSSSAGDNSAQLAAELESTAKKLAEAQKELENERKQSALIREQAQKALQEAQDKMKQDTKARESLAGDLKRMQQAHTALLQKYKEAQAQIAQFEKNQPRVPPESPNLPSSAPAPITPSIGDAQTLKAEADKYKTEAAQLKKIVEDQKVMLKRLSEENKKLKSAAKQAEAQPAQTNAPSVTESQAEQAQGPSNAGDQAVAPSSVPKRDPYEQRVALVQAVIRGKLARAAYPSIKQRANMVKELLDTEVSYVATLETICNCYIQPLRHMIALGEPIVSEDDIAQLFSTLEQIYASQQQLLKLLQERISKWHYMQTIGDVLVKILNDKLLHPHVAYIQNFPQISETNQRLMREVPNFAAFVKMSRVLPGVNGRTLEDLLINPVQRIPRYKLLVSGILSHTPKSHPDYNILSHALGLIEEFAVYINENNRRVETLASTTDRVSGLEALPANPDRRLIFEGRLNHILDGKKVPRYVFLFSDFIVFTKESKKKRLSLAKESLKSPFKMVTPLKLNPKMTVEPVSVFEGKHVDNMFSLSSGDGSVNVFAANSEEEKQKWIDVITAAVPRPQMKSTRKKLSKRTHESKTY